MVVICDDDDDDDDNNNNNKIERTNKTKNHSPFLYFYLPVVFTPSPHPSTNKLKTSLFAGAVAGTVVFIIVVITLFVCERRRRNKPLKVARGFEGVTFTAVSMRDRIRAETIRALDESKVLTLFNPDDMRQVPLSSVEYIRDLGSGNFGLVFLGKFCSFISIGHLHDDVILLVRAESFRVFLSCKLGL